MLWHISFFSVNKEIDSSWYCFLIFLYKIHFLCFTLHPIYITLVYLLERLFMNLLNHEIDWRLLFFHRFRFRFKLHQQFFLYTKIYGNKIGKRFFIFFLWLDWFCHSFKSWSRNIRTMPDYLQTPVSDHFFSPSGHSQLKVK